MKPANVNAKVVLSDEEYTFLRLQAAYEGRLAFVRVRLSLYRSVYPLSEQNLQNGICTFGDSHLGGFDKRLHTDVRGEATPEKLCEYLNWLSNKVHAGTVHTVKELGK